MEQENNNQRYGKLLKAGAISLALLSLFLFSKTISEIKGWRLIGKDIAPQTVITVSGKGEVVVRPDIVTFTFSITSESLAVATAQDKTAKAENTILASLRAAGIASDDIKVSGYNIYPRYDYTRTDSLGGGKQVLAAYVVSESVEVKVRQLSEAGKIIGGLGALGATNVSGLSFSVDKPEEAMAQAREKAIADAKMKGQRLAADLGVRLSRIVTFSENGFEPRPLYYDKVMTMSAGAAAPTASPELPSGTDKITSNVSITYEIR